MSDPEQPREVDLTAESYGRWLRAYRPQPMPWFLGLSPMEQEAMAELGDEYAADQAISIGLAVADPQAASAGMDAMDDPAAEEMLVRRLAVNAIKSLRGDQNGGQDAPAAAPPPTMAGVSARRQANAEAHQREAVQARDSARSMFGRKPDPEQAPEQPEQACGGTP